MRRHNYVPSLLELAEHLETGQLLHERFDFSVINSMDGNADSPVPYCGTSGCAAAQQTTTP